MCGKENSGFNAASANLFRYQTFILCPNERTTPRIDALAFEIVTTIGARPLYLSPDLHDSLVATDSMDGLISLLANTAYAPDLDAALPRFTGLRRLDEIVRHHLVRVLGAVPTFYDRRQDDVISLLTDRWDLQNLRTLLRAKSRLDAADEAQRRFDELLQLH